MARPKCELDSAKTCPADCLVRQIGRARILKMGRQFHPAPVVYAASILCARVGGDSALELGDRVSPLHCPTPTGRDK